MPRKEYTIHYIYKITCTINGRYYIGMHSTFDLEDGYMGSGKRIKNSINKHGLENHIKEILEFLPNRSSLKDREKEIVNEELLNDSLCMNLQPGGGGGLVNEEHKQKWIKAGSESRLNRLNDLWKDKEWSDKRKSSMKENWKDKDYRERCLKNWNVSREHSEETKELMRKNRKGKQAGSNNSQFGKTWITNGKENKKIFRGDLIPKGWKLGRKIKTSSD
jgi:group I intron endonuclease